MGLTDPLDEKFWKDTWVAVAVHNVCSVSSPSKLEAPLSLTSLLFSSDRDSSQGLPMYRESLGGAFSR